MEQGRGVVLRLGEVVNKTNAIPSVRDLATGLDPQGCMVNSDAMHPQQDTAPLLRDDCEAHHVITATEGACPP